MKFKEGYKIAKREEAKNMVGCLIMAAIGAVVWFLYPWIVILG
jgi:hypothetical protein